MRTHCTQLFDNFWVACVIINIFLILGFLSSLTCKLARQIKMDFDSALIEAGEFGPYQRKLFIVTNLLAFPISAQMLIMVFIAAKPEWSCSGSDKMCTDDGSICSNARFISNFTSLAGEWGLVCGQAYKVEALQSFYMFGNLLGAPVLGSLADSYGRKPVYMVCYIGTCATALISAFATSYNMFMILRFITGFFVGGGGLIVFVLTTESLGTKYRGQIPLCIYIIVCFFSSIHKRTKVMTSHKPFDNIFRKFS